MTYRRTGTGTGTWQSLGQRWRFEYWYITVLHLDCLFISFKSLHSIVFYASQLCIYMYLSRLPSLSSLPTANYSISFIASLGMSM